MRKFGADALALGALAIVAGLAGSGSGCSTTKPTELVPGVLSQIVVPRELKSVRVTVTASGRVVFDQGYDVGTNGAVALPSTLGVVSAAAPNEVVTVTIRGYEDVCTSVADCNLLGDMAIGEGGPRVLRRSIQTFVDQHILFLPMPLSYSCWNQGGCAVDQTCKANTCVPQTTDSASQLVDFTPSLVDGSDVCFSPKRCFSDAIPAIPVDPGTCTYAFPAIPGGPKSPGLNVRVFYQNFTWTAAGPVFAPVLKTAGEQEVLSQDPVEGFTTLSAAEAGLQDGGAGDAGTLAQTGQLFRLAPGLCKLAQAASNPPNPPPAGAGSYITISDIQVANVCSPKLPLLPLCAGEQTNAPTGTLPGGSISTDGTCNASVPVAPTPSALYLVMDHSAAMHGAFGPMGSATALSLSLSDPVFKRTYAAFKFLPGAASDCTSAATSFTTPDIDFGLAAAVQPAIADKLNLVVTPPDGVTPITPLELQAATRLDAGAYAQILGFLKNKEAPNVAAAMIFVNRAPDTTNDCSPPLGGAPSVQQALENQIASAFAGTPSLQTYFVVLDDDAHDATAASGALTFFNKVASDLPSAVQVIDATKTTTSAAAAQTVAANFSKLVTRLGTCLYDYDVPAGTDPTKVEVKYAVPGRPEVVVPLATTCSAATQDTINGWNFDAGRLRICGSSCRDLRDTVLASAAAALQAVPPQNAPDIPITATILCSGTAPISDAGPEVVPEGGSTGTFGPISGFGSGDASTSTGGGPSVGLDGGVVAVAADAGQTK